MDIMTALLTLIASVVGAVLLKLLSSEVEAWLPKLAHRVIDRATRGVPESERDRYREEWYADLEEFPGKLSKLFRAIGFYRGATKIQQFTPVANSVDEYRQSDLLEQSELEVLFFLSDRFEVEIQKKDLSVLVVDHRPTDGEEARDILFFMLDKLEDARMNLEDYQELNWDEFADSISMHLSNRASQFTIS